MLTKPPLSHNDLILRYYTVHLTDYNKTRFHYRNNPDAARLDAILLLRDFK